MMRSHKKSLVRLLAASLLGLVGAIGALLLLSQVASARPMLAAPVVSDIPDQTIDEGSAFATINLDDYVDDAEDPDEDIIWTYGGNVELTVDITDRVATITIPDPDWFGSETIVFTATDTALASDSDAATFTVNPINDPPVVSDIPGQTIDEGSTFTTINLDGYVDDEEDPDTAIIWTYGGNVELTVAITDRVATITIPDPDWFGSETIVFTATDTSLASDSDTATFTVNNVTPTINSVTNTGPVAEASPVTVTVSATDPGSGTDLLYSFDWDGNGSFGDPGDIEDQTSNQASYTWLDDGIRDVTIRVSDGTASVTATTTITVNNVAPIVYAGPDDRVYEGETVNFSGVFTDTTADTHEIVWDFGDGASITGVLTPTHVYSEPADYTVTLTVTDDDSGVGSDVMTMTVQNLAPTADAGGPYTGTAGIPVTMSASASSDPGGGPLTYSWDLDNDGLFDDATGEVVTYTWTVVGTYTVTVQVADAQLVTDVALAQVSINPAELNYIVLSPATATIFAWENQAYTVEAFDVYSNSRGNVTTQTTFSIVESGHGGYWLNNVYFPQNIGEWTVQAVYTGTQVTIDTASLTVQSPIMRIEKSSDPDTVEAGATLTYTLIYSNTGNSTATSVTITDNLDTNTSFITATPTPSGGLPNAPVWSVGSLAPGGIGQITITVAVDRPLPNNTMLTNVAWLDTEQTAPVSATSQITVSSRPVLTITKSGSPNPVAAGQNLIYTIIITNTGNENASAVTIVENYDPNVSFITASRFPDYGSGNTQWSLGTLAVDTSASLVIVVRVADILPVGTILTNEVTLDSAQTTPISTTENTQALSESILEITQVDTPDPVSAGGDLSYVIWYENTGSAPATNVVITVTPDSRVTYTGDTVWEIGTLDAGESSYIVMNVEVDTPLPDGSVLQNLVTIDSDQTSPAGFIETTAVTSSPELSFSITQQPETTVQAGAPLTYTLYYTNTGNADATQVVITATMDGFAPLASATPAPSGGGGSVWYWEIASIPGEGGYGEIVINAEVVLPLANGTVLSFTAQLNDMEGDSLEDTIQITVTSAPALSLSMGNGVSTVYAGDVLTYTLDYANNGNENAYDVTITDTLPISYTQYQLCEIPDGTCGYISAANVVTFHLPALAAQTSGQAQVVVQVDDPLPSGADSVTNRVTMTHPSLSTPIVRQDTDDIGTLPDLTISATHEPSLFSPSMLMTYTLTYGNAGRMHAEDVLITTTLPPDTTYEGSGWSTTDGHNFTYAAGDLLAGDTGNTAVFTVRHLPGLINVPEFVTSFTIVETGGAGGDAKSSDNSVEVYIGVPDLVVVSFTVEPMPLQTETPTTFTIVIENQGTGIAWNPKSEGGFWVDVFFAPVASYPSERYGDLFTGVNPIAAGGRYTATIHHTLTEQEIREITAFYVRVDNEAAQDPYGLVPESDEMNNLGEPIYPLRLIYLPLVQNRHTHTDGVSPKSTDRPGTAWEESEKRRAPARSAVFLEGERVIDQQGSLGVQSIQPVDNALTGRGASWSRANSDSNRHRPRDTLIPRPYPLEQSTTTL